MSAGSGQLDPDRLACQRVGKMQDGAVQCVAGNNCIRAAVEGVPRQRVADIRHMDADLMSAPGAEPTGHKLWLRPTAST